MTFTKGEAFHIIESLRKGIPPIGYVRYFTVGRENEIAILKQQLSNQQLNAILLNANYGSGKTHLIRFIREEALEQNYAVSVVTLDAKNGIRFNRMDQIFGEVCRKIEMPVSVKEDDTSKGIRSFLNIVRRKIRVDYASKKQQDSSFWAKLSSDWKWDNYDVLNSYAMFVAIRAWFFSNNPRIFFNDSVCNDIEDWLLNLDKWKTKRTELYQRLISPFNRIIDAGISRQQAKAAFSFSEYDYAQCWLALCDLNNLSCNIGLKGLVILFDEFEDVLTNVNNIGHQENCFWNLFHFCNVKFYNGKTFFAVTPEFNNKCETLLLGKGKTEFNFKKFELLQKFQMSPLEKSSLVEMGKKIVKTHSIAYDNWDTSKYAK